MMKRHMVAIVVCCLTVGGGNLVLAQEATQVPQVELSPAEQKLSDQLTNAVLVGRFSVDRNPNGNPKPERYTISAITKIGDGKWIVQSRVTYGDIDVPVPVPVEIHWAGDTPVLQVTDLTIPLIGSQFTARVMFYGDRYAGSWAHGKVGGHMWGHIESMPGETPSEPESSDADSAPSTSESPSSR